MDEIKPKFAKWQTIRHRHTKRYYQVLQAPPACSYNGADCYLLKPLMLIDPVDANSFYRVQADVEFEWEEIQPMVPSKPLLSTAPLFKAGDPVRHIATGGVYRIVISALRGRLEQTNEPAYSYESITGEGPIWHRSQTEMEDGRFQIFNLANEELHGS